MKPIIIKMQAFGPYSSETICDFRKLYDNSLFLITGPTGSGKTTILDAMCFALYGAATGGIRSFADMRNLSSPPQTDTVVSFDFSLYDTDYRFIRTLSIHKKRSGEFETKISAECYNLTNYKLLETGASAVTAFAEKLLHFTNSQFSQVIVLPQGEFRRLLLSNSATKSEILQVLFGTEIWRRICHLMRDKVSSLNIKLSELSSSYAALIKSVNVQSLADLITMIDVARNEYTAVSAKLKDLFNKLEASKKSLLEGQSLYEDFLSLDRAKERLSDIKNEETRLLESQSKIQLLTAFCATRPYLLQYNSALTTSLAAKSAYQNASDYTDSCRNIFNDTTKKFCTLEALKNRLESLALIENTLMASIPEASRFDELSTEIRELNSASSVKNDELNNLQKSADILALRAKNGEEYINKIRSEMLDLLPDKKAQLLEFESVISIFEAAEKLKNENLSLSKTLEALTFDLDSAETSLKTMNDNYFSCAAAQLAQGIHGDSPCPVCGSKTHPRLAQNLDFAVDRETLENHRLVTEDLRRKTLSVQSEIDLINRKLVEIGITCPADISLTIASAQQLKDFISTSEKHLSRLDDYKKSADKFTSDYLQKQSEITSLKINLDDIKNSLAAKTAVLSEITRKLERFGGAQEVLVTFKKTQSERLELLSEIQQIESSHRKAEIDLTQATASFCAAKISYQAAAAAEQSAKKSLYEICQEQQISPEECSEDDRQPELISLKKSTEELKNNLSDLKTEIKLLSEKTAFKMRPDIQSLKATYATISLENSTQNELCGRLLERIKNLKSLRKDTELIKAEIDACEISYSKYKRISDLTNGQNPLKTPLHMFVVGLMLDEVIVLASQYLERLSRGRYQLCRTHLSSGNALKGLDIGVIDAHLGACRSVGTLSGGELFLASLSLAFGLSEVASAYAGGVRLDSIFIDEGFGTLDSETLECAMRALSDIQGDGRLVGIISHVSELKLRIPSRIDITVKDGSSHLTIIN